MHIDVGELPDQVSDTPTVPRVFPPLDGARLLCSIQLKQKISIFGDNIYTI